MCRRLSIPVVRKVLLLAAGLLALPVPLARGQEAEDELMSTKSKVEYIDSAIPGFLFRFRFDAAYDNNRPDRAEYFYSQYQQQAITGNPGTALYVNTVPTAPIPTGGGSTGGGGGSGGQGRGGPGPSRDTAFGPAPVNVLIGNPNARGLPKPETAIDYQDVSPYLEIPLMERLSVFVEAPTRFLNPQVNNNTAGFADMNTGFKYAFLYSPDQVATFQLRTYLPTGAASHGLGTNHVSLEPALLFYQRLSDRAALEGELRDWIPIGGTDFEGNVVRYGAGVSYRAWDRGKFSLTPVVELVGWTVLDGKETVPLAPDIFEIQGASGDTIVNLKVSVRVGLGEKSDVSIGYGRALTGDVWYKDILRVEYRLAF